MAPSLDRNERSGHRLLHCNNDLACSVGFYVMGVKPLAPSDGPGTPRSAAPEYGRLVRVRALQVERRIVGYVVAVKEADKAVGLVRTSVVDSQSVVEDVGRVSGELLKALGLVNGQFVRTDRLPEVGCRC